MATRLLANYLRTYRKNAGLTQQEAAYVVGINRSDLWFYETGRREPSLRVVIALLELYRMPIWKLYAGIYQECVLSTDRRLQILQRSLLKQSPTKKPRQRSHKLGWISARLNLPLPATPL